MLARRPAWAKSPVEGAEKRQMPDHTEPGRLPKPLPDPTGRLARIANFIVFYQMYMKGLETMLDLRQHSFAPIPSLG
jgi:hypothetical protein